ncbi:MAG: NlpC/P60 family protein [Clostridiales bacterium]|nr:NlpC/P60 family protein [Clostridiales bacterium]
MKDIKSKPKNVRSNTHKLKTSDSARGKATVQMSAVDSLKRQYVKSKTELQKQTSDQMERPENYAVDEVEDKAESTAYASADTVRKSARYVKNKIQHRSRGQTYDIPVSDIPTQEPVRLQRINAPKTAALQAENKTVPQEQMKIKARQEAAVKSAKMKTKDVVLSSEATKRSPEPMLRIKSKAEYVKTKSAAGGRNYRLKSDKVYKSKAQKIKPKTLQAVRAKQEKQTLKTADNKNQAARKYVQNKLKTKSEIQNTAEIKVTDIQPVSENPIQADVHMPKQKPTPQEQIKVKKTDIKTRDSYIHSHARNVADVKAKPSGTEINPYIISQDKRIIKYKPKNTIKSVQNKASSIKPARKIRMPKTAQRTAKKSANRATVKTQKQVTKQAAKQAAKRSKELARRSVQTAKAAVKTAFKVTVKVAQAVAAAAKELISALAALGGWAVMLVVLIIVIIIAAIAASPFGIFISEEVTETGTIPLSQIISEYNIELTQAAEDIELSVEHTEVEVIDNQTNANIVIAVFAAKTAGAEDNTAEDVVVFDDAKAEKLKEYFRASNTVEYTVEETQASETETTKKLTITISGKTKEELMDEYGLTGKQREAVETLLEHGDVLTASSHSLAITNADVQSIINGLPSSLPQKQKDVVKNAGSLVGKVNYFWGGKSSAIGWDNAWGSMRRVTAAGSPSSGTIRAYGLDCSGFVSWVFNNSGMYVGDGTYGQRDRSVVVSTSAVQAGDLAFLPSYSHVGIVVGQDISGNILVIHCSSSANNVVVSTASSVGFTVFRRPNCY